MASDTDILIKKLRQVEKLLTDQKREENLSNEDWKTFSVADSYFGEEYHFAGSYSKFLKNLPPSAVDDYIDDLQKEEEEEEEEPKKEESSIPPELESLVAEYQENQALLEQEEIKASSQKTVAAQVQIAIAHSKIKNLALANRNRRVANGEKFKDTDSTLVSLGSPKSESKNAALAASFKAVQEVAFTYSGFSKLPPEVQNQIISAAVDLNTVGVSDIDTAIQASTLQIDTTDFDETTKKNLATIPGGFVSSVYNEVVSLDQKTAQFEDKLSNNEQRIVTLQESLPSKTESERTAIMAEITSLTTENDHLSTTIENQSTRLTNSIARQTELFKDFEKSRERRLSQDPDLKDRIELANKTVASLHENLTSHGVSPHIPTPMDDAHLLEQAIRHDMPGALHPNSGYEAEYAASLVSNPQTQNAKLSPQAILLYGKELTPKLLAKARQFAQDNPDSALGQLFTSRKDLFDTAGTQLRKIFNSPLGKEITRVPKGIFKSLDKASRFIGKISDKIPGGIGTIINIVRDPWGTLRSWAGRKAGEYIIKQIAKKVSNEVLKKGAEMLLKNGVKETVKKLLQEAVTKAAVKLAAKTGVKLALEAGAQAANVIPGLGIVIAILIDVAFWIGEKIVGAIKSLQKSIYGEEVKAKDLLAVPAMVITSIGSLLASVGVATTVAIGSAIGTITAGALVGFFFYVTSLAVAPLISTLVQLDSVPKNTYNGPILPGCPQTWPIGPGHILTQGPGGNGSHFVSGYDQAIDIDAPIGTPVISTTYGTVNFAGYSEDYMGTNIVIVDSFLEDGTTFKVVYAHLTSMDVETGDSVEIGSSIGTTGTAGTGPHLHYEYKGILYNQCPAGGIQLSEYCPLGELFPGQVSCSDTPQVYTN